MRIRRLEPAEADLHRELRLRALALSPASFGETLDEVEARPPAYWDDLTRSVTEPDGHVMFLACDDDAVFGSAYGLVDVDLEGGARVGGMWVEPERRRQGAGRALLDAVLGWARERGLEHAGLWAPADAEPALSLYGAAGFVATGARRPLPSSPDSEIVEMELWLVDPPPADTMPAMDAAKVREVMQRKPDYAEEDGSAAFWRIADYAGGMIWAARYTGQSPWERHPDGDELLYLLEGKVEVTVLSEGGPELTMMEPGSVHVVPRGLWHRQESRGEAEVVQFGATPGQTEHSTADDPRA